MCVMNVTCKADRGSISTASVAQIVETAHILLFLRCVCVLMVCVECYPFW